MVLNIRMAIRERHSVLTAPCISSSSPVELQYCLRTTLHIDALAPASECFFFLVANLKRAIIKMGNVACVFGEKSDAKVDV